jgi:ATP-dependent helicase HrpA
MSVSSEPAALAGLRTRLAGLTLHDEHRLGRHLERLRGGGDEAGYARLAGEVARAEGRIERRRAAVPSIT